MSAAYYWLDLVIGFGGPVALYVLHRKGVVRRRLWSLFLLGASLGLLWEVPVFVLSSHTAVPIIRWVTPLPLHYSLFVLCHTLWDGLIFAVGAALVFCFCPAPALTRPRWPELVILVLWGQVSAMAVELSSVLSGGWVYMTSYSWNPTLFVVAGMPVTALMQVTWLGATLLFYPLALRHGTRRSTAG